MRRAIVAFSVCVLSGLAGAQDGIYGSFNLGQKFVDMGPLNTALHEAGYDFEDFINNYFTIGGEGHIILAKHFVVGGKGVAVFNEHLVNKPNPALPDQRLKVTAGMGVGSIGYAFLGGAKDQFRLFPTAGLGLSTVLLQCKTAFPSDTVPSFADIMDPGNPVNDRMTVIQKVGLALDFALGMDYFIEFIELKALVPGLTFGPMIHAEAGYTLNPVKMKWTRDVDALSTWEPDVSFQGFYWSAGVGIGLSSARD